MDRLTEQRLIRDACAGDRGAAEVLVRAHQGALFAYVVRMVGRRELAEDLVQEAFVRALTNLDRFDARYRFSTWLFTIARRLTLTALSRRRVASDSERVSSAAGARAGPDASAWRVESRDRFRDRLSEALLALPEHQREIVILFHQQGWPVAVIARFMGMPEGTVKSHLHRARRRLRVAVGSASIQAWREALA